MLQARASPNLGDKFTPSYDFYVARVSTQLVKASEKNCFCPRIKLACEHVN